MIQYRLGEWVTFSGYKGKPVNGWVIKIALTPGSLMYQLQTEAGRRYWATAKELVKN